MKKLIATSLVSLLASASLFGAQASIQIFGNGFTLDKETLPTGTKVGKSGKTGVSVDFEIGADNWKNVKLRGSVEKNTTLRFIFYINHPFINLDLNFNNSPTTNCRSNRLHPTKYITTNDDITDTIHTPKKLNHTLEINRLHKYGNTDDKSVTKAVLKTT